MPTYEYECTQCGKILELFQSIKDRPKRTIATSCAHCHDRAPVVRRIGTGAGVIFKGSGFYQTDYRSESYRKAEQADKQPDKPPEKQPAGEKAAPSDGGASVAGASTSGTSGDGTSSSTQAAKSETDASPPAGRSRKSGGSRKPASRSDE
jgi:putative FmdB family regulatory protein